MKLAAFYREGDKSRAICSDCGKIVSTTFAYRDVPFDDGSGTVADLLAGVCDGCGGVVSIPAQSCVAIARVRETATVPLEVRLPAREVELLDFAAHSIDPESTTRFRKPLIAFFLNDLMKQTEKLVSLKAEVAGWRTGLYGGDNAPASRGPKRRVSFKLAPKTDLQIAEGMRASGLDRTGLIQAVIMRISQDVLESPQPKKIDRLRDIARVVNA